MRSPRSRFELACRIGAFAILGWMLGDERHSVDQRPSGASARQRRHARIAARGVDALPRRASALHGDFNVVTERRGSIDWLAALRAQRPRRDVEWIAAGARVDRRSVGRSARRRALDIAAPAGTSVVVARRGERDRQRSRRRISAGALSTPVVVVDSRRRAGARRAAPRPISTRLRSIVVVGGAGWEGKFIVAALEERGWPVIARFSVAPNVDVAQGCDRSCSTPLASRRSSRRHVGPVAGRRDRSLRALGRRPDSRRDRPRRRRCLRSLAPGSLGARIRARRAADRHASDSARRVSIPCRHLKPDAVALERRPTASPSPRVESAPAG